MKKPKFLQQAKSHLVSKYGAAFGESIYSNAVQRYQEICHENSDEPKEMHQHTRVKIYPCISVLDAQINLGIERGKALKFMYEFIEWRSYNGARFVSGLMKFPGLYKKVPVFFGNMTKQKFGTKQRFDAVFHEISDNKMHFDMTKCPYKDMCTLYGYPEITKAFCRGDDIVYGNMHPKIIWGRTKTLGDGDEHCNFLLTIDD